MIPLIPFAAGIVTGAALVALARSRRAKAGFDRAEQTLRRAGASSLAAIQRSVDALGDRQTESDAAPNIDQPAAASATPATPRTKRPTSKKTTAKPASDRAKRTPRRTPAKPKADESPA